MPFPVCSRLVTGLVLQNSAQTPDPTLTVSLGVGTLTLKARGCILLAKVAVSSRAPVLLRGRVGPPQTRHWPGPRWVLSGWLAHGEPYPGGHSGNAVLAWGPEPE